MKRYIRASFSSSMPSWLRKKFETKRFGNDFRDKFLKKTGVALDKATFSDSGNLPIYLIQTDFGEAVYAPGINDDNTERIGGRNRKLGSIAKSKLNDMAIDVVYVDTTDSANLAPKRERYRDPRYTYRHNPRGQYAGQYKRRDYLGEGQYGDEYWSSKGMTPSNEARARDKSGYVVPSPEQKIADYYTRFPEKITNKLDSLYDRLQEVKQELNEVAFNSPRDYNERYSIDNMYMDFGRAVRDYRDLLKNASSYDGYTSGRRMDYFISELASSARSIKAILQEIEDNIG